MGNAGIQIAAGLAPLVLFCAVAALVAKRGKLRFIALGGAALVIAAAVFFPSLGTLKANAAGSLDELGLVYAVADAGDDALALEMLGELRRDTMYRPEYALAAARISASGGDTAAAKALYLKTGADFPKSSGELETVTGLAALDLEYYGAASPENAADAAARRGEAVKAAKESFAEVIEDAIGEDPDKKLQKAAGFIVGAGRAHSAFLKGELDDTSETSKELKKLDSFLSETPEGAASPQLRLARLKYQLLTENYKKIAQSSDENSDYNELLIVSELYLNGLVKNGDFQGEFGSANREKYETVYNRLSDIYTEDYQTKPREERKSARSLLDALGTVAENPALGRIEEKLLGYAESDNALDASKVWLQAAKIEHALGNDVRVGEFLDRSLDTVGDCEDSSFTAPMYQLAGIISDKDSPERLRDAAKYAEAVLSNNMTVKLPASVAQGVDSGSLAGNMKEQLETYVSQKRMSVKIVNVDTTDFGSRGEIRATVNFRDTKFTDAGALAAELQITDCGLQITDFEIEKVNYGSANILLCVDVSGSMDGDKIKRLREAVALFVSGKEDIENISIIAFDDGVSGEWPFGTSVSDLEAAADSLYAGGGTNMYGALIESIERFEVRPGEINSIILMSDGQDNYPASFEAIERNIGAPCRDRGITVYSIGFGSDADIIYLNELASVTGGFYLNANESDSTSSVNQLSEFFEGLRAQILNQYLITFKATDTLSYSRELIVQLGASGLDYDKAAYYLGGGGNSIADPDVEPEESPVYLQGKAVFGFEPRLLFKNGKTQTVLLRGAGFESGDTASVTLRGTVTGMEYNLGASIVDSGSVSVTIPAGIAVDIYDADVKINGKFALLRKGFSVFVQGGEIVTEFGQYRFTSYIKNEDYGETVLSGFVRMNGWLDFNDAVRLSGDLDGSVAYLTDLYGSQVAYNSPGSTGIAATLAGTGQKLYLPPLGVVALANDAVYESANGAVRVEAFPTSGIRVGGLFAFGSGRLSLYPNRLALEADSFTASMPFAEQILQNKLDLFSFKANAAVSISAAAIDWTFDLETKKSAMQSSAYSPASLGNLRLRVAPADAEVHIDTRANRYSFKFGVDVEFFGEVALQVGWGGEGISNGIVPSEVILFYDDDKTVLVSGVPVTFSDFSLGVKNIDTSKNIIFWTLTGGCDVSGAKLSALGGNMKGLEEWIGDVSILKIDDLNFEFTLGDAYFKATGGFRFLEAIDVGGCEIEAGRLNYTSQLLGMNDAAAAGLRIAITAGPSLHIGSSSVTVQGTGELDLLNAFFGLQLKGVIDARLQLWIIAVEKSLHGEIGIGFRQTPGGQYAFIIRTIPKSIDVTWPKNVSGKL